MKSFTVAAFALVVLCAVLSSVCADYYKKPLEIKHVWTKHDYGHGYGHNDHGYGHGNKGYDHKGYGHKLVGYSKVYHHQDHHHGNII